MLLNSVPSVPAKYDLKLSSCCLFPELNVTLTLPKMTRGKATEAKGLCEVQLEPVTQFFMSFSYKIFNA